MRRRRGDGGEEGGEGLVGEKGGGSILSEHVTISWMILCHFSVVYIIMRSKRPIESLQGTHCNETLEQRVPDNMRRSTHYPLLVR